MALVKSAAKGKKTTEVLINTCYGGFGLSSELLEEYSKATGKTYTKNDVYSRKISRHDPILISLVKKFQKEGKNPGGKHSEIEIEEIEGVFYRITEYDGMESVETPASIHWEDASSI